MAMNLDWKAVDVNRGAHHRVISIPAGAAQVAVRPIK